MPVAGHLLRILEIYPLKDGIQLFIVFGGGERFCRRCFQIPQELALPL